MDTSKISVLVVDDDILIRGAMVAMLESMGVGMVTAVASMQDVRETAALIKFNGAFVDLVLEKDNGKVVADLLLTLGVPVVFVSAIDDEFNLSEMYRRGWVIPKPINPSAIKRALQYFYAEATRCDVSQCESRVKA